MASCIALTCFVVTSSSYAHFADVLGPIISDQVSIVQLYLERQLHILSHNTVRTAPVRSGGTRTDAGADVLIRRLILVFNNFSSLEVFSIFR